ncbi:MAG: ABC transporter permease [Candidatus Heimdallarchaeota archaeon]|nr:MAG: ABC transporter permease [Candidatus Heimdallarchaeota archaeon]
MVELFNPVLGNSIVAAATFFLIPTLGEIYAERSGILNLGIEGMVIASAAGSYAFAFITNNVYLGILFGILLGGVLASAHAIITVTFNRNQIVSGIGLTILGTGLSGFLGRDVIGKAFDGLEKIPIPLLSDIPTIGPIFFNHSILVYLSYLLVPLLWFILFKTRVGILIRTVGENPSAAYNQGVKVRLIRYCCVIFGGMCAGLGGAYLSLSWLNFWAEGMTQGRGWIVIALVVVALWNPLGALFGSYLFGSFDVLQFSFQHLTIPIIFPEGIPAAALKMMPPLSTILFLAIWAIILSQQKVKSIVGAPTALAVPFED